MTLKSFKSDMIKKARAKGGLWENFGQSELRKLEDKYNYNPYASKYGDKKKYMITVTIKELREWVMNVTDEDIR
jgi:hypothetical protein